MKLSLLEDGVLDYKGNARTLATPNADPAGTIGAGIKPAPMSRIGARARFEQHVKDCPQCGESICDVGQLLIQNL